MTLLSYILHRRSAEGFRDSLLAASAVDHIHLSNLVASSRKKKGSGDAELDAFNQMLEGE